MGIAFSLMSCSPSWIRSNPPSLQYTPADSTAVSDRKIYSDTPEEINFADAFDSSLNLDGAARYSREPSEAPPVLLGTGNESGYTSFIVPENRVRIALLQNITRTAVYSVGSVRMHSGHPNTSDIFRGRILFERAKKGNHLVVSSGFHSVEVVLPCTLMSDNEYNFIEIGDTTYRGALIIAPGRPGTFTVVNYLEVEEYLRGVVPLELGRRPKAEMEALKAQAVAARTYTYRRILERKGEAFDMVRTVADQVYGGAVVEYREADAAIKATRDLIMVSGDSIILAYYHSTCGGMTADVNEAWKKPPQSYLHSMPDTDGAGNAWCRGSTYFTWEESWPRKQFSAIVMKSLRKIAPGIPVKSAADGISVDERFACGRVRKATIAGRGWVYECGGDQIRFIIRRAASGNPILRSSNFKVISSDRATIRLKGKGYGHGVGMCQMGAMGRARAGQDFVTILRAYYSGVGVVEVRRTKDEG